MSARSDVVEAARGWLGTPYRHQASRCGAGTDCLGLLRGVWRELYSEEPERLPAYTPDWDEVAQTDVLLRAARAHLIECKDLRMRSGDVLLFRMRHGAVAKHLGIVASQTSFVHAYSGHGVVESTLSEPWRRRVVGVFAFPPRD